MNKEELRYKIVMHFGRITAICGRLLHWIFWDKSVVSIPRENSFGKSAYLLRKKSCAVIENPTVMDTRQAVASGHFSHFTIGIATYKYPAPTRHFGLAAPLKILRQKSVSIPREIHREKTKTQVWAELSNSQRLRSRLADLFILENCKSPRRLGVACQAVKEKLSLLKKVCKGLGDVLNHLPRVKTGQARGVCCSGE